MSPTSGEEVRWIRITFGAPSDYLEALSAALFDAGALGIEEGPGTLTLYDEESSGGERFKQAARDFEARLKADGQTIEIEVTTEPLRADWQETWQKALKAQPITDTLVLRPLHDGPAPAGENTLWFEPCASFGSGDHPTTRLAARRVQALMMERPGARLFDVGTGTGVLALVAAKIGQARVLAVDIDEVSVRAARENAVRNDVSSLIQVEMGSADYTAEEFDVVVANINTPILLELREALCARVKKEGVLLLTGLLEEDIEEIDRAFAAFGLTECSRELEAGWALLVFRKPASPEKRS